MPDPQSILNILSGRSRGLGPTVVRTAARGVEPFYSGAMRVRNALFNTGIKHSHALARPVVSVGNLTTGGTGKTPVVQWLCEQLIARGHHPAVLLRGYRSAGGISDEAELYRQNKRIEVEPDPDRVRAAARVLARSPDTSVFVLDDGFQHRRVKRDLDIVLVDASNPFGFGHLLPRGLLREPIAGIARAHVIVITRATDDVKPLVTRLRKLNALAPIYICRHRITCLLDPQDASTRLDVNERVLAFAGVGNPESFAERLRADLMLTNVTLDASISDHHPYSIVDLNRIVSLGAFDAWVTTEKDFVKIRRLESIPITRLLRAQLRIDFADGHADELMGLIMDRIDVRKTV